MTSALKTPWGKFPLPLPGGTQVSFHLRIAGTCGAEIAAAGGASSSPLPPAAARYLTDEGDLVAVPPFVRAAGNRFSESVSTRACVAAREGVPPDALPRAPP